MTHIPSHEQCTDAAPCPPDRQPPRLLFVSSTLSTWLTETPELFSRDFQINETVYRQLDPEYYAWLRSRMVLAKKAAAVGHVDGAAFEELRVRFNAVHEWAVEYFGESRLLDAVRDLDSRDYAPPVAEPDAPSRTPQPPPPAFPDAIALVDQIRDRALALGWAHDSLYAAPCASRTAISVNRGLVSYLKPGDTIGEVTTYSIEIILPNNIRQRFYNPNTEQPWIRRVK